MSDCGCEFEAKNQAERRVLYALLGINASMFLFEFVLGWKAQSTGLIADSLDMLADASVYAVSLYAVGRALSDKARAARLSGWLQIGLGVMVLAEILRRTFMGSEPESLLMMAVASIALVANVTCLALIRKHRDGDVHMRASWIFSANDVIANLGVILAGALVWLTDWRGFDLLIGTVVAVIVIRGGVLILKDAGQELAESPSPTGRSSE